MINEFAQVLKSYRVSRVQGDHYGGEFPRELFRQHHISYETAKKPKSDLYRELLPLINSGRCELLDHPKLISQLTGLERRTARSGRDSIDHAPGAHDDVANAVAGALLAAQSAHKQRIVAVASFMGGLGPGQRLPPARYFDPATGRTLKLVDPVSGRVLYDAEQPRISALSASNNGCNPGKGINPPPWLDSVASQLNSAPGTRWKV